MAEINAMGAAQPAKDASQKDLIGRRRRLDRVFRLAGLHRSDAQIGMAHQAQEFTSNLIRTFHEINASGIDGSLWHARKSSGSWLLSEGDSARLFDRLDAEHPVTVSPESTIPIAKSARSWATEVNRMSAG